MDKRGFLFFSFLLLLCPLSCALTLTPSDWQYLRPVALSGQGSLSDFQVEVILNTESLIAAGKMRPDCGDAMFTDSDKVSILPYFLESGCGTQETVFWVKVPFLTFPKTIYVYYGRSAASTHSSGDDTFVFFDDFEGNVLDSSKWDGNPTVEVSSGYLHLSRPVPGGTSIRMNKPLISTGVVEMKARRGKDERGQGPGVFLSYTFNAMEGGVFQGVDYKAGKWGLMIFKPNTDWSYGGDIDFGEHVIKLAYAPGIVHYANIDASLIGADKHITNASFTSLQLGAGEGQMRADSYFDWIFIRKYSDPEPGVNVGAEETPAAATTSVASSTTRHLTTILMTTTFPSTIHAVTIPETTLMANPISVTSVPIVVTSRTIQETALPEASSTTLAADNLSAEFEAWKKNQSASVNETPKDNSLVLTALIFVLLALSYMLLSGFYKKKQGRSGVINQCQESAQRIESLKTLKATVMKEFHTRKLTEEDARKMILECEKDMILERSKLCSLLRKLGIRSDDVSGREEVIGWIIEKLSTGEKPSLMKKELKEQGIDPKLVDIIKKAIK
jgi:hypothetical protein